MIKGKMKGGKAASGIREGEKDGRDGKKRQDVKGKKREKRE